MVIDINYLQHGRGNYAHGFILMGSQMILFSKSLTESTKFSGGFVKVMYDFNVSLTVVKSLNMVSIILTEAIS